MKIIKLNQKRNLNGRLYYLEIHVFEKLQAYRKFVWKPIEGQIIFIKMLYDIIQTKMNFLGSNDHETWIKDIHICICYDLW